MPVQFKLPPMLLLGPLVAAVVLYLILRWVVWEPKTGASPETVSQHALWVGVIGWMASSLQGAMNIGIIPAGSVGNPAIGPSLLTPDAIIPALAWPILGTLGVHAVGQLSYPRPKRLRRTATLQVRRIRDFLPRPLAWTTLAIFAAAATFIAWTATLPGFRPVPYGTAPYGTGPDGTVPDVTGQDPYRYFGGDGRIPGTELAVWLGTALAVLAAGTWLVLLLISRRRQLEPLSDYNNALLRTIAMNRLLRTVATIASGLAVIAGNFVARPDPGSGSMSWTNFAAIPGIAVLLAMLVWAPPKLAGADGTKARPAAPSGGSHPAARLVSSVGAALGVAAALPLLAGVFFVPALMAAPGGYGPPGFTATVAVLVLLVLAAGELLLQRNYAKAGEPRTWPRQPVAPGLLTAAILALLVFLAVLVVTGHGNSLLGRDGGWVPAALASSAAVAAAIPAFCAARFRHGIPDAPPGLDAALRAVTLYRLVRTLAAMLTAQAGLLLMANSHAWAAVFGTAPYPPSIPWWPASLAGSILAAAAVVMTVVPVGTSAAAKRGTAQLPEVPRRKVPGAGKDCVT
ncbi:hypothetical protein [Arthrobacter sp. ISL-72]|uniref:hypothetical protein n=1 Tax=Arthrobacter sp. ISL-72 TaxID=2819114 RepID=UPI001BE62AB3|nr:hypothetical protein [Arthrobacter sp. ISL-72]MBT2594513.1 hypothetical protein [Arthrobacter sp. ISL-72]